MLALPDWSCDERTRDARMALIQEAMEDLMSVPPLKARVRRGRAREAMRRYLVRCIKATSYSIPPGSKLRVEFPFGGAKYEFTDVDLQAAKHALDA